MTRTRSSNSPTEDKSVQKSALKRQPQTASLVALPKYIPGHLASFLTDTDKGQLLSSCLDLFHLFKPFHNQRIMRALLQAVIDDKRQLVKNILDSHPGLLLVEPSRLGVKEITSKLTWQIFLTEKPFIMALKRKQLAMIKLLLPYFNKLEELQANTHQKHDPGDAKNISREGQPSEVFKQWVVPELSNAEREREATQLQRIYLKKYLKPLIKIIRRDKCTHGFKGKLHDRTEKALDEFRKKLLPDEAVSLNNYFDIEQLLTAAINAEQTWFRNTLEQRLVFINRVIGFIITLLNPELAKIFCEGVWNIMDLWNDKQCFEEKDISATSQELILKNNGNKNFYRSHRKAREGQGFEYVVNIFGIISEGTDRSWDLDAAFNSARYLSLVRLWNAIDYELKKLKADIPHLKPKPKPEPTFDSTVEFFRSMF